MTPVRRILLVLGPLAIAAAFVALLGCASPRERPVPDAATDTARETPAADRPGSPAATAPAFNTYDEAMEYVRATYDGERIDTSRSSWITGGEYFEAGGRGYLILGMNHKDYIFEGVPTEVWGDFKVAPSLGSYYNGHIRGRYGFKLH